MTTDLRPLRAGELLDRTFSILRDHFLLFAGIAAIPLTAEFALNTLALPLRFSPRTLHPSESLLVTDVVVSLASLFLLPIAIGASAWAVSRIWKGQTATIAGAYRGSAGRIPSLIGATLLAWLALSGAGGLSVFAGVMLFILLKVVAFTRFLSGLFAVILGGIVIAALGWIGVGMALAQPAIVLEGLGPLQGLRRSWSLAQGCRRHVLMVGGLYLAVSLVVHSVVTVTLLHPDVCRAAAGQEHSGLAASLSSTLGTLAGAALLPLLAIGLAIVYLNQRVVKEAFDLQVMLSTLEMAPDSGTPAAASLPELHPPDRSSEPSLSECFPSCPVSRRGPDAILMTMLSVPHLVRRLLRLFLAGLLMLPGAAGADAQSPALSPAQYRDQLRQWRQQVQTLEAHPEKAASLAHTLPPAWRVQQDGAVLNVSSDWLRRGLLHLRGDHQHPQQDAAQLEAALGERLHLLVAAAPAAPDVTAARGRLRQILARPEFRGVHPPSAAEQAKSRFWAWVRLHLDRLIDHLSPHPQVLQWLVWLVILLAMGVAVRLLWQFSRGLERALAAPALSADRPSARPWQTWLTEARAAAGAGNFRDSIHLSYWAAISWLESEGAWMPDRARTPREYLRLLPARSPHRSRLRSLTERFEHTWYGGRPALAADFDAMLRELEELGCR